jgi:hypothetical protein
MKKPIRFSQFLILIVLILTAIYCLIYYLMLHGVD